MPDQIPIVYLRYLFDGFLAVILAKMALTGCCRLQYGTRGFPLADSD